VINEEI
jgi:hypothetical protein